jgi:hypothetical protein
LAIGLKTFGPEHFQVALSKYSICYLFQLQEMHILAIEQYAECLAVRQGIFGTGNRLLGWDHHRIGQCFLAVADFDNADRHLNRALPIRGKDQFADLDPVAATRADLASLDVAKTKQSP